MRKKVVLHPRRSPEAIITPTYSRIRASPLFSPLPTGWTGDPLSIRTEKWTDRNCRVCFDNDKSAHKRDSGNFFLSMTVIAAPIIMDNRKSPRDEYFYRDTTRKVQIFYRSVDTATATSARPKVNHGRKHCFRFIRIKLADRATILNVDR